MSFSVRNNPQQLKKPMSRQAFRPGQWGAVKANNNITYNITNNFHMDGCCSNNYSSTNAAWDKYDSPELKTMQKIGLSAGILGKFLDVLGLGKKKESVKNDTETPKSTPKEAPKAEPEVKTPKDNNDQTVQQNQEVKQVPKQQEAPKVVEPTIDNFEWSNDMDMIAMDDLNPQTGKSPTEPIQGKVGNIVKDENSKLPKSFTVTEGGHTYKFEKTINSKDGNPQYKCTGRTGSDGNKTYATGNLYECRLVNGKPQLIQTSNMEGWGSGLDRFNSKNKKA